jgi:hypothetical protein
MLKQVPDEKKSELRAKMEAGLVELLEQHWFS